MLGSLGIGARLGAGAEGKLAVGIGGSLGIEYENNTDQIKETPKGENKENK